VFGDPEMSRGFADNLLTMFTGDGKVPIVITGGKESILIFRLF